jgi:hypothetical protein
MNRRRRRKELKSRETEEKRHERGRRPTSDYA